MRNADALDLRGDARFKAAVFLVALLQHQGKDQDVGDDAKLKQSAKLGCESFFFLPYLALTLVRP